MNPVIQYEVWRVGDDRSGYPVLVTNDKAQADHLYQQGGYDVVEYMAYPVMD